MTGSAAPPNPGERRLDRPPSDRYRDPAPAGGSPETRPEAGASTGRAAALGVAAGLLGAAATVVLGGALGISAGLLIVAGATGWAVAAAVGSGAGAAARPAGRIGLAVGITLGAVVVGQLGLWLYARTEGGVLPLPDYLAQTFGLLVPAQAAVAVAVAWWTAR